MGTKNLRTFGLSGKNLPVKQTLAVVASDFLIGGIIANFERSFNKAFKVKSPEEFSQIFGGQVNPNDYGPDAVKGFFDNTAGTSPTLWIQSFLGWDGNAIDSVIAEKDIADCGADADAYTIEASFQEEPEYGVSGNRTGFKITHVNRFSTLSAGAVAATGVSTAILDSVIGIVVGDIICFKTNGGANFVYKVVTAMNELSNSVSWSGDFEVSGGSAETLALDDEVVINGFTVQTYRESITGIVKEVNTELGTRICSTESAVSDFYVENIHASNNWIKITESSASTLGDRLPVENGIEIFLSGGANGTAINNAGGAKIFYEKLNDTDVRFLANPESTNESIQKELELYSKSRTKNDNPIVIPVVTEDRTKSQLITIGNSYQRSDEVDMVIPANWLKVSDPFTVSANAPLRNVPNCGHIMGLWIRTIATFGIHYVPATNETLIQGAEGVVGDQFLNNRDRTDLAENGINLIQEKVGIGIKLANCRTPSTSNAYAFGNGILMRNFIKASSVDSLSGSENTPNSIKRLRSDKMAIVRFLKKLWKIGSTGDVPEGETFGQTQENSGEDSTFNDHVTVSIDPIKNSKTNLQAGERTYDTYFTYPAPAESIQIGVGILLR
jgi:hypothetical protein